MRRTFILHANGAKLPSDLLGFTCVRYGDLTTAAEMRAVTQKLRKAIEGEASPVSPMQRTRPSWMETTRADALSSSPNG